MPTQEPRADRLAAEFREAETRMDQLRAQAESRHAEDELDEIADLAAARERARRSLADMLMTTSDGIDLSRRNVDAAVRDFRAGLHRVDERYHGALPAAPRNRVVQVARFGGADGIEIADAPLPVAGPGEVRVRVLASSLEYTDVVIRRHLYLQTIRREPPFVLGYDVVGEIDQVGEGVVGLRVGDRVADMTVLGSNASYRTLEAADVVPVPDGVDAAEAAAMVLSWTTAYQLLHRAAHILPGRRVLVHGAAGAVGQALLALGARAGLQMWGTARREHAELVRSLGATPIDYQREDFTQVLTRGFDVVFDGIGEDGYRRSLAALHRGGTLCGYGYTASVQRGSRLGGIMLAVASVSLRAWLSGKHARIYSINLMRARHPEWFREDLARLFSMLAAGSVRPRVAERISFDEVVEAHRRIEAGGLDGKIVLCPA